MTHVLCAPYSSVINVSWTSVIKRLEHALKFLVPNVHMCVTPPKPAPPPPKGEMSLSSVVNLEW